MRDGLWPLWLASAGCPWVPLEDHRINNQSLSNPPPDPVTDTDTDTDTDADTDTDTDVDTDTGTLPTCEDDAFEPNGTVLTATEIVSVPSSFSGVMCPEDLSQTFGFPLDLYEIDVASDEVLTVRLDADGDSRCNTQTLAMKVTDELANVYDGAQGIGNCPEISTGWGSGTYYVWVYDTVDAELQSYTLEVDLAVCSDEDDDGFLAQSCGGPDCSDLQPDRYPGAIDIPLDTIDQDCDGGDDLASTCGIVTAGALAGDDDLGCGTLETGAVWDRWTVPVTSPDLQLSVVAQNDSAGVADLVALIVDPDGTTHYGLESDRSQMDDEGDCASPAWTGEVTACPAACVEPTTVGDAAIWVAQWPGAGCVADASYTLLIYGDGTPLFATLTDDDVPLAFPP